MSGTAPHDENDRPREDLPPTGDPAQPDEAATLDSSSFQISDDDANTIDSASIGMPRAGADDSEAHTIDSAVHKVPPTARELPESQASTILPIEDNLDHFEGVDELPPKTPDRIATFNLMGVIGTGGMGRVYLAIQDRPRRHVALKVMKPGIISEVALRRFEFEAELLARLVHSGIAQIYEAGTWDSGEGEAPYFAMEYVRNSRILSEYCDENNLDHRQRVELFIDVCEAVGFGHQKGIVHRDLKPGNILVDSRGNTKIIDFGVARSTESDTSLTMQTDMFAIVGTLQYMAPEQCEGDALDLDTSADVYALGITLFELLAGTRPYSVEGGIAAAIKAIREAEPDPLSQHVPELKGELEAVVAKALEKDRSIRYRTASEFGDDLRRWLNDEPTVAQPQTFITSFKRVVRRNRSVVLAGVLMLLLLTGAVIGGAFALINRNLALETRNELLVEQSEKRAMVGDLISTFMRSTFDSMAELANSQEARENLINISLDYLDKLKLQAGDDPELQRMLVDGLQQAGINQWSLQSSNRGNIDAAIDKWEESVLIVDGLREQEPEDAKLLSLAISGRTLLSDAYRRSGRSELQEQMLDEAEELAPLLPDPTGDPAQGRLLMGVLLDRSRFIPRGDDPESQPVFVEMLELVEQLQEAHPDEPHLQRDATLVWNRIGFAYVTVENNGKALEWYQRALDVREDLLKGKEGRNTARRDVNLNRRLVAEQLFHLDRRDEAIAIYRDDIIPLCRELIADSPNDSRARTDLTKALQEYGEQLVEAGRYQDAIKALREAAVGWRQRITDDDGNRTNDMTAARSLVITDTALATALLESGELQSARTSINGVMEELNAAEELWPESEVFPELERYAKSVRNRILEQLGTLRP